jgi:hypothetical protein
MKSKKLLDKQRQVERDLKVMGLVYFDSARKSSSEIVRINFNAEKGILQHLSI